MFPSRYWSAHEDTSARLACPSSHATFSRAVNVRWFAATIATRRCPCLPHACVVVEAMPNAAASTSQVPYEVRRRDIIRRPRAGCDATTPTSAGERSARTHPEMLENGRNRIRSAGRTHEESAHEGFRAWEKRGPGPDAPPAHCRRLQSLCPRQRGKTPAARYAVLSARQTASEAIRNHPTDASSQIATHAGVSGRVTT